MTPEQRALLEAWTVDPEASGPKTQAILADAIGAALQEIDRLRADLVITSAALRSAMRRELLT